MDSHYHDVSGSYRVLRSSLNADPLYHPYAVVAAAPGHGGGRRRVIDHDLASSVSTSVASVANNYHSHGDAADAVELANVIEAACSTGSGLKSYSPDQTTSMKERADAELATTVRKFGSHVAWPIGKNKLEANMKSLMFFADKELNDKIKAILLRENCRLSFAVAIRTIARIYWSKSEMIDGGSMRLSSRKKDDQGVPYDLTGGGANLLPHLRDLRDLFMHLCDMDRKKWILTGKQELMYGFLNHMRKNLKDTEKEQRERQEFIAKFHASKAAAAASSSSSSSS